MAGAPAPTAAARGVEAGQTPVDPLLGGTALDRFRAGLDGMRRAIDVRETVTRGADMESGD